jgi:hypothetical protein
LTLSTAQITAPVWWRGSFITRLATHQVKTPVIETATSARPIPTAWERSILARARLKKMTGGSSA